MGKTFNFSAGPAVLPESVLQEAADEMLSHRGSNTFVMEAGHRSVLFQSIIDEMEAALRTLMNIPNDYEVLFLQSGTSLQFAMTLTNFMRNRKADHIVTGYWAKKAYQRAKLYGETHVAASSEDDNLSHIPDYSDLDISPDSDHVYTCENSTIYGTKFHKRLDSKGKILINDISSCFLFEPMNASDHDILFGGIQRNLGPAGLVIAIIRKDLISEIILSGTPIMLQYKTYANKGSMYNTPPIYNTYIVGKVIEWIQSLGGLDKMKKISESEAALLYDYLDKSNMFRGLADKDSCSLMNITFRTDSEAPNSAFVKAVGESGITSIKGHRTIGGIRADLYNAVPIEGVQHLVQLMETFERSEGQYE